MRKVLSYLAMILFSFSVLYYSWLQEPSFSSESYMPGWLVQWSDEYGRLRTAVPFVCLGLLGNMFHANRIKAFLLFICFSFLLVLLAEIGQLFLPQRFPDWADVLCALGGGILGYSIQYLFGIFKKIV